MVKFEFLGDWPADVLQIAKPVILEYLHLLPGWCLSLHIRFEDSNESQSAAVSVSYGGRHTVMYIRPGWLQESLEDRHKAILHEIAHIHVQPIKCVFTDLCNKGIEDKAFQDFVWEQFKDALEGSVEDLAWAFYKLRDGSHE